MLLLALFAVAFLAATILPLSSEAAVLYALTTHSAVLVWSVATAGNVLGALVNGVLGRYLLHFQHASWFPVSSEQLHRAQGHYQRWGQWTLLLSWLPLVGDAFTVAAGVMRLVWWRFLLLVLLAKGGRYWVLIVAAQQMSAQ